jgi:hypothetical protein
MVKEYLFIVIRFAVFIAAIAVQYVVEGANRLFI